MLKSRKMSAISLILTERESSTDPVERFCQEMGGAYPWLEGAEWLIHVLLSEAHALRRFTELFLHYIDDSFVLPATDAALRPGRTVRLEHAPPTLWRRIHSPLSTV